MYWVYIKCKNKDIFIFINGICLINDKIFAGCFTNCCYISFVISCAFKSLLRVICPKNENKILLVFFVLSVWRKIKSGDVLIQIFNSVSVWSLFSSGYINEDRLRELLMTMGDRFTEDEVTCSFIWRFDLGFVKWVGNSFYTTVFEKAAVHDRIRHTCKTNCCYNKGVSFVRWNTL